MINIRCPGIVFILIIFCTPLIVVSCAGAPIRALPETPVAKYGMLSVKSNMIVDRNGDPVQLKGVSLFWSQWGGKYWNNNAISYMVSKWHVSIIRAAMGVDQGGYLKNMEAEKEKVERVVGIATNLGIYVIIDWHDNNAGAHADQAAAFFREMAGMYRGLPNVLYEPWNEPIHDEWKDVKKYAEGIIRVIRDEGVKNIVLVGTTSWSRDVDEASLFPIKDFDNIAYSFHFYAGDHKQGVRDKADFALKRGVALFVSEWGTCLASGNGGFNPAESDLWIKFMDDNKLSWCNWSLNDKDETASILLPGADTNGGWTDTNLTESGKYVVDKLLK
jgi:endoglucanase